MNRFKTNYYIVLSILCLTVADIVWLILLSL